MKYGLFVHVFFAMMMFGQHSIMDYPFDKNDIVFNGLTQIVNDFMTKQGGLYDVSPHMAYYIIFMIVFFIILTFNRVTKCCKT